MSSSADTAAIDTGLIVSQHNNHTQQKCDKPGDLLCCDTCNLAFHMRCLGLREHEVPDDFRCVFPQKHPIDDVLLGLF